jgi:hypothetical protein
MAKNNRKVERIKRRTERIKRKTAKIKEKTVKAKQRTMKAKGLQEPNNLAPKLETKKVGASSSVEPIKSIQPTPMPETRFDKKMKKVPTALKFIEDRTGKVSDKGKAQNKKALKTLNDRMYGPGTRAFDEIAESSFTTPEEFAKIDAENPVQSFTGNQVADQVATNANSSEEAKQGQEISNVINKDVDNINKDSEDKLNIANNLEETEKELNQGKKTIKDIAKEGDGQYSLPFSKEPTPEEMQTMIDDFKVRSAIAKAGAPKLALEKLEMTQYYPPQEDFLQSSFVGRYIGSRTITSAVPARVPVGLYDARKRALKEKAKDKKKALDLMSEFMSYDTAEQFEARYDDAVMNTVFKYLDAADYDAETLLAGDTKLSQEFYKETSYLKNIGASILAVSGYADKIIEDAGSEDFFVPKEVIEKAMEFKRGQKDITGWLKRGPKSEEELQMYRDAFRSYESFTKLADNRLQKLKELGPNSIPLKRGADYDAFMRGENTEFAQNAANVIQENKSRDWSEFTKSAGKYWDIDAITTIVREMHAQNNLYPGMSPEENEKIIQGQVRYMLSHLSKEINLEQTLKDNKSYQWAQLRLEKQKFGWQKDKESYYYERLNNAMEPEAGKISEILNNYTGEAQQRELDKYFAGQGLENVDLGGFSGYDIQGGFGEPIPYNPDRSRMRVQIGNENLSLDEGLVYLNELREGKPSSGNPLANAGYDENTVNDYIDQIAYQRENTSTYMNADGEYYVPMVYDESSSGIVPASHKEEVAAGKVLNGTYHTLSSNYKTTMIVDDKAVETTKPTTLKFGEFNLINNPANQASLQSKQHLRSRESSQFRNPESVSFSSSSVK